ncbi:MAG: GGDEF domain-containing protein [Solirubrobacterales bacterium]|nr:GGDEF domain-containing protein [Solirubrobacterales bacterium]
MELSGFPRREPGAAGHAGTTTTADEARARAEADESGFASIGLPAEAGWYVSAALYWIGGLAVVLIDQLTSNIDPVIGVLGTIELATAPLLLLGARFAPDAPWGAPVRILMPSIILVVGGFVVGGAISALVLLLLFPVLAVAYMHKPSVSIPYCSAALLAMNALLLAHQRADAQIARAIVLTGVAAALVTGLVFSQSRLRRAAAANHSRSITDPLTGLANLRGLRARLRQELQRSTRDQSEIVMFAIDLDDFKEVNDRFSYALGDAVLQSVAQALAEEVEPGDLVARRGGDEFAILTIATPGRHMARFGDRIAASIERTRRAICPDVNPRASVTRVAHVAGETAEAFLRRVDDGLHDAKLDAHPERFGITPELAGDHPQVALDEHNSRALAGARRAHVGRMRRGGRARGDGSTIEWRMTAATAFVPAALITIVVGLGLLPSAQTVSSLISVLGLIAIGAGALVAARKTLDRRWLHPFVAATLGLMLAGVALSGDARYALAELSMLSAPLAVMLFGWRPAIPYVVVSGGAYAYFVIASGQRFAVMQAVLLIGVLIVLNVLLQRGDRLADEFSAAAEAMSVVDPLTGAANIRGFEARVEQEIARCEAMGDEVCLTMIDLDRFKDVNDRYSHSIGDALLIETARAIESVAREDELVVRRGGDEFVVVCAPGLPTDLDAIGARLAEAILTARVRLTPDIVAGATVVNVLRHEGEGANELMQRADEELRLAKANSRAARSEQLT